MNVKNTCLKILLSLSLLLAGVSGGYGMGLNAGGQNIVICGGDGAEAVMIGANGQPVPIVHKCLDCCLSDALPGKKPLRMTRAEPAAHIIYLHFYAELRLLQRELNEWARGPPALD